MSYTIQHMLPEELTPPPLPIESERTFANTRIWLDEAIVFSNSHPMKEKLTPKELHSYNKDIKHIRQCLASEATKLKNINRGKKLLVAVEIAQCIMAKLNSTYIATEMAKHGGKMKLRGVESQQESNFDDAEDAMLDFGDEQEWNM